MNTTRLPTGPRVGLFGALAMAVLLTASTHTNSPVADAAMRGDSETVRVLLKQGEDANAAQGDGMTALHWAGRSGDGELARLLIMAGASLEHTTRIGSYTPLLVAARSGNEDVVLALLGAGANARARTSTGVTALHFAAGAGAEGAIAALVEAGVDVDVREMASGQTPLMFAASNGKAGAIRALAGLGADVGLATEIVDLGDLEEIDRNEQRERERRIAALRPPPRQERAEAARPADGERATPPGETVEVPPVEVPAAEAAVRPPSAEEDEDFGARPDAPVANPDEPQPLSYNDLIGGHGGMTALLHAVRQGHTEAALALVEAGADVNERTGSDNATPMLIAAMNGHWDLALELMDRGADPNLASDAGTTPLYAALNVNWAPKSLYPQPRSHTRQQVGYLDFMRTLLEAGADPNVRLEKHLWFMSYNFDLLGVDTGGATPFWRAAYALDIPAMKLLLEYGADPNIPTRKSPERRRRGGDAEDPSGLAPIPVGGPAVYPIHAATGVGYGKNFAANAHRYAPGGWLPAVRFLVEELGADVNLADFEGYTPLHHAASRGDVELINYLVEKGADVKALSRRGQTTADMANGPVQRVEPYPEAIALLESLGSENNNNCLSC